MAQRALVSTTEPWGNPDDLGLRVLEVVNPGEEFETHPSLEWHDCDDTVQAFKYWYKDGEFKKLPEAVDAVATAGELSVDGDGNPTEQHIWDWDTETWSKQAL